jgi:hypothetical protein
MKRVLMLVEGQTEERFIKDVLCPYFWDCEIDLTPKIATTKRVMIGPHFKGGITNYPKVERDVRLLLNDTGAVSVTTFIDYYALPSDFPGMASRPTGTSMQRAIHVETEWAKQVNHLRFHPYLMVHEFEAILFCKPEELGIALYQPRVGRDLAKIRASFPSPEEINEGQDTAPSKRIINCSSAYQKTVHGPMIAKRIGLQVIREQCNHFNNWLNWLESL